MFKKHYFKIEYIIFKDNLKHYIYRKFKKPKTKMKYDKYTGEPRLQVSKNFYKRLKEFLFGKEESSSSFKGFYMRLGYKEDKSFSLYVPLPEYVIPKIGEDLQKAELDEETRKQLLDIFRPSKSITELCKMSVYEQMRVYIDNKVV
jgi:hypothetical protein